MADKITTNTQAPKRVLTPKQALNAKIDQVVNDPKMLNIGRVNAGDLVQAFVDNTPKQKRFGREVFNLAQILGEKVQMLASGKPIIVENKAMKNEVKDFIEEIELQETFFILLKILFDNYTGHVVIEKIDDKVTLRIADPRFPNVVYRMGKIAFKAEVWVAFKFERAQYWKLTTYDTKEITNQVFTENSEGSGFNDKKSVSIDEVNKQIKDEDLHIKAKANNDLGFIPVEQIQWLPSYDLSTSKKGVNVPLKERLEPLQEMLNESTLALRRELYLNRTKLVIDQTLLDKNQAATIADESIIAVLKDTGDYEDKNKIMEMIQGDPKLESYWFNIKQIITLAVQSLKLSEMGEGEGGGGSATEAIFNKGNDIETVNTITLFHQKTLSRILAKAKAMKDEEKVKENDIDVKAWSVQIVPNVIMNEAKLTEIVIQQLGAGLINMVQAKVKLEGISQADAEEALSQEEQFQNPSLMASMSLNDDGEEPDGDEKQVDTKDTGNSVVDKK